MICELCQLNIKQSWNLAMLFSLEAIKQKMICSECWSEFEMIDAVAGCSECQIETNNEYCNDCLKWLQQGYPPIRNQALFKYNAKMKAYFKCYKFEGGYHLRNVFNDTLKQRLATINVDQIVPIPVSEKTYEQRGFNQVIGWLEGITFAELLECRYSIKKKQSHKSRQERLNTEQPFKLAVGQNDIKGQSICLVDDVYTTGRTLRHATQCLLEAGARDVVSITLSR